MNTKENELIALFMGMQKTELGWFDNEGWIRLPNYTFDELLFDKDWNWLIPVTKKIYELSEACEDNEKKFNSIMDCIPFMQSTYDECVDFARSYVHPEQDLVQEMILDLQQEVFRYQIKWSQDIIEICNNMSSDYRLASNFSYNKDRLEAFANGLMQFANEEAPRN